MKGKANGYYKCETTPGLWRHKWRATNFVLIVDDFGVEYVGKRHAEHLLTTLQKHYTVTTDWTGSKFAGIDIAWDYNKHTCCTTMPGYIDAVQICFGHPDPTKPEDSPHKHRAIAFGAREQYANHDQDTSPKLDSKEQHVSRLSLGHFCTTRELLIINS